MTSFLYENERLDGSSAASRFRVHGICEISDYCSNRYAQKLVLISFWIIYSPLVFA